MSTLTSLNQIPFWRTSTSSNPTNIWEKILEDWKIPLKGGGTQGGLRVEGEFREQGGFTKMFSVWFFWKWNYIEYQSQLKKFDF